MDIDPRDTLKLICTESLLWAEEHASITQRVAQNTEVEITTLPSILGRWCFTNGSLKDQEIFQDKVGIVP